MVVLNPIVIDCSYEKIIFISTSSIILSSFIFLLHISSGFFILFIYDYNNCFFIERKRMIFSFYYYYCSLYIYILYDCVVVSYHFNHNNLN